MNVYFALHGRISGASEGRLLPGDAGLSEAGKIESMQAAESLRAQLGGNALNRIISSPRNRTLETAAIIAGLVGFEERLIEPDQRLVERDCGLFVGQLVADVFARSEVELVAGGMEPLALVYSRTRRLHESILQSESAGAILLVGHSGNLEPLSRVFSTGEADGIAVPVLTREEVLCLQ